MIVSGLKQILQVLNHNELNNIKNEISNLLRKGNENNVFPREYSDFQDLALLCIQNGKNQHINVDINRIFYIDNMSEIKMIDGETIVINRKYNSVSSLMDYFENDVIGFKMLDKKTFVNMDAIVAYDSFMERIYVDEEHYLRINGTAMKQNKKYLSHLNDLAASRGVQLNHEILT